MANSLGYKVGSSYLSDYWRELFTVVAEHENDDVTVQWHGVDQCGRQVPGCGGPRKTRHHTARGKSCEYVLHHNAEGKIAATDPA